MYAQTHTHAVISSRVLLIFLPFILKIKVLERENLSSQQSLDNVVHLATEQNICAKEKYEEVITVQVNNVSFFMLLNLIMRC